MQKFDLVFVEIISLTPIGILRGVFLTNQLANRQLNQQNKRNRKQN